MFFQWSKYSCSQAYPVPHELYDSKDAFYHASNLWDITTQYGRDRRELCGWFADRLEERLNSEQSLNYVKPTSSYYQN